MSLLRIPGEGILAVLPDLRQGLKESAAKLEAHGTSPRRAGMSPARSFPPMSGNPAPSAELVSSWLSLRAVHPVFLQTGVRTLYTVYAEGPRPRGPRAPCIRARTRHTWRGRVPSGGPAATGGGGRRPPPPPPTTQTRAPLGAGRKAERARQNPTPGPRPHKQTGTPAGRKIFQ